MPVIVIGADTPLGGHIVAALAGRAGEMRAFVTDSNVAERLKQAGWKVAIGDVSDASHVGGAAINCFSAILVAEAASDNRQRSFADDATATEDTWVEALADARVRRAIWVGSEEGLLPLRDIVPEAAWVDPEGKRPEETAAEVARLDDLASLEP